MKNWRETSLGDVCELYQPKTISSADLVEGGAYPVYGANGVIGRFDKFNHAEPQLLVTCRGATCGAVNISQPNSWINGNAMVVKPRDTSIELDYLKHMFGGGLDLSAVITGAAQPQITRQSLAPLKIRFPAPVEQRRIAAILDQADALRAMRRKTLAQLDSLTQSIFIKMFGKLEANSKGFPLIQLGTLAKVMSGYAFKSEDFSDTGSVVIRISNLTGVGIDFRNAARIQKEFLLKGAKFRIYPGDILIAMSGATTGKLGVVPDDISEDLYQNQRVGNYKITSGHKLHRSFLIELIRSDFYQRSILGLAWGAAQPNVSSTQLESIAVPLPPMLIQKEFDSKLKAVQSLKNSCVESLAELDTLFLSLQHRAFHGDL
jgi:type I restriction enzyme S subunit